MKSILSVDIISTLPDDILGHILSVFPTKEAVRTSILSKRWRYVWAFASKIKISDCSSNKILPNFTVFTYKVLRENRVCCLEELEFEFTFNYNLRNLRKWMYYASLRETVKLNLEFPFEKHVMLPTSFFSSNKLVSMSLGRGIILKTPKSMHFPSLKSLILYDVQFSADDSIKNTLDGSPVLEMLSFTRNRLDIINTLNIQSNSLTFLLLDVCEEISFEGSELVVVIEAPNLLAFHIYDCSLDNYKVGHFPFLLYENISICEGLSRNDNTFAERLGKMSSAECPCLAEYTFEYLRTARLDNLPIFNNLTELHVEFHQSSGKVWIFIFASTSNLKILESVKRYGHHDSCEWHSLRYVSHGLSSSLEIIEFAGFGAYAAEMEMVAFLLKNARVLKKIMITLHELLKEKPMLYEELRYGHHDSCEWHSLRYVSHGLSSSLEIIEFSGFGAYAAEMEMVAFLLKNARVLKKMMITLHELLEEKPMLYEELVMLPKVSVICQVELC